MSDLVFRPSSFHDTQSFQVVSNHQIQVTKVLKIRKAY